MEASADVSQSAEASIPNQCHLLQLSPHDGQVNRIASNSNSCKRNILAGVVGVVKGLCAVGLHGVTLTYFSTTTTDAQTQTLNHSRFLEGRL